MGHDEILPVLLFALITAGLVSSAIVLYHRALALLLSNVLLVARAAAPGLFSRRPASDTRIAPVGRLPRELHPVRRHLRLPRWRTDGGLVARRPRADPAHACAGCRQAQDLNARGGVFSWMTRDTSLRPFLPKFPILSPARAHFSGKRLTARQGQEAGPGRELRGPDPTENQQ